MPEGFAAVSARPARTTKSIISPGSSLATIGLAIPAVGVATYALDEELTLGLGSQGSMLLLLTFFLSMLTFGHGQDQCPDQCPVGLVHMVVFAVCMFTVFVP
jgi:Ca2+:H+ antiporter